MGSLNKVHVSIDDVIEIFYWISMNRPDSIFEQPLLKQLKQWHEIFYLKFDLYMFEQKGSFRIQSVPIQYWRELGENATWLQLAWHRRIGGALNDTIEEELESIDRFYNFFKKHCGAEIMSETVRLHRWTASEEIIQRLIKCGVVVFLTADTDDLSCDLTPEEMSYIKGKYILRKNIVYKKTILRLDCLINDLDKNNAIKIINDVFDYTGRSVEVFFHEKNFGLIQKEMDELWYELEKKYV